MEKLITFINELDNKDVTTDYNETFYDIFNSYKSIKEKNGLNTELYKNDNQKHIDPSVIPDTFIMYYMYNEGFDATFEQLIDFKRDLFTLYLKLNNSYDEYTLNHLINIHLKNRKGDVDLEKVQYLCKHSNLKYYVISYNQIYGLITKFGHIIISNDSIHKKYIAS